MEEGRRWKKEDKYRGDGSGNTTNNLLEIEHPDVGELVDDVLSVVPLGHHGVVEEGEHGERLDGGQRLQVSQLLGGDVGGGGGGGVGPTL